MHHLVHVTKLTTCNRCDDEQLAWVKSKRTGRYYLAQAYRDGNELVANASAPHKCPNRKAAPVSAAPARSARLYEPDDDAELRAERRIAAREEADYQLGIADGNRYSAERRIFGEELANRFAMEDEMARWNAGEDY